MAVSTKRKNSLKSKSNSKTRKQFKKFRKSRKNVRKMKGGNQLTPKEIIDNYYLCTYVRHHTPIESLIPFGEINELSKDYNLNSFSENLNKFKKLKENSNKIFIPSSPHQFGTYFRFVKKENIDNKKTYKENSNNFSVKRSFVFNVNKLLNYIYTHSENSKIPLCWFTPLNGYGIWWDRSTVFFNKYSMQSLKSYEIWVNHWLKDVGVTLLDSINNHEFVCRIPLPLNEETGFLGKIHADILTIKDKKINNNLTINDNNILEDCYDIKNKNIKLNDENKEMCQNTCNFHILHPRKGKFYCSETKKNINQ